MICICIAAGVALLSLNTGCKKFIELDAPVTSVNTENVYANDATAISVLTGLFGRLSDKNGGFLSGSGGLTAMSFYPALSADELSVVDGLAATNVISYYYKNALKSNITGSSDFWNEGFQLIYIANSAIEGISASNSLTPAVKQQLLGEAYFMRAFCYFQLVNLYGDLPLILTSDYKANSSISRTSSTIVYQQIISDAKQAQSLLNATFNDITLTKTTAERVRPNKYAATALLAKTYLYTSEWAKAEVESTALLSNTAVLDTVALNNVFLKNSKETIWSLQPTGAGTNANTGDARIFLLPSTGPATLNYPVYLNPRLVAAFELNDKRKVNWTGNVTSGPKTFYYPTKYKIGALPVATGEYVMVFRLGEQYLIRAEARAQLNNLSGALSDLNAIRKRSGLGPIIEDKNGGFWFGAGGVFRYDGKSFTAFTHNGKPFKNVRSIIEDKKGNIWLGGADGLWRYNGTTFTNFTQDFVGYIYEDRKGNIWTSSQRANEGRCLLSRYDENSLTNKKPTVTEILSKHEGNKGMIFGILEANDGSIWFGTMVDGVCRYDGKTITNFKSKEDQK